jgi:group I intron endonuclease
MPSKQEHGFIYLMTNTINGKRYVGLTTRSIEQRIKEHVSCPPGTKYDHALQKAIRKHGIDNFEVTTLQECDTYAALRDAEIKWIGELNTHVRSRRGYNMTDGGDGVIGHTQSLEQRRKNSETHKNLPPFTPTHRDNIRKSKVGANNPMFGKRPSIETRAKRSASLKGRKLAPGHRANISKSLTGKKQTQVRSSSRPVRQLNTITLEVIAVHVSIHAATRSIGPRASASNILYCCRGARPTAYGYKWQFA